MGNKIFFKIGIVVVIIILIYIFFISFVISPKISNYLVDSEINQARAQLDRVLSIIKSKENSLKEFKKLKIEEYKVNIKNISNIAYSIMDSNYQLYKKNKITKEEAIETSLKAISRITYGFEDDYIYVLDRTGKLVYHPDKKYQNRNIYYTSDANGKLFVNKIIDNSIKNKESYTSYTWSKLNSDFVSEKIVHSIYFKPFDLIVSSGLYIENIKTELKKEKQKILEILTPLIKSIILGDRGYIFIMDQENRLVLHPDKEMNNADVSEYKQPNSNKTMVEELRDSYEKNVPWKYKWNSPDDKENYKYEKVSWVKYNKFFDWYIVSSIYEEDLKIKSKEISNLTLNISVVLLLSLLLVAMFFIQKLLKPITILSKNAELIKNGKFDIRNNIKSNDEIGILANQFDRMLDYIEDSIKNLEEKVEQRTSELEHKLYFDELTGLKNRFSLNKELNEEEFYALSLIDIDEFNSINELYGFDVGNEVLKKVALLLEEYADLNEMKVYKVSSDVFALVDKNILHFSSYEKYLIELIDIFRNQEIHIRHLDIDIFVYVTIGCAISQEESVKTANIALKKAKKDRCKYMVYCQEIDTKESIKNTMYWREKIKDAIERDRLVPFYQPIYDDKNRVVKYETLMRIKQKEDGETKYLSPGYFLDIAVKTKQYFKLNQIIIEKSLKNLKNTSKDISVNISFADILNLEFVEILGRSIKKLSKAEKRRVVFEILESDFISDYEILEDFIQEYRNLGIRIAIDDFGTGYSNFSHIMKIKPDYIKIDGSLIKNLDKDMHSLEIVKSIIDFSHSLGIKVIAEFIHSPKIYEIVVELGVDEFQGFYLGEPTPLIE